MVRGGFADGVSLGLVGIFVLYNAAVKADILVIGGPKNDTMYRFADQPASFGPDIPEMGVTGYLVLADPLTACEPVRPPPVTPVQTNGSTAEPAWILLIKRGNCDFDKKILHAQSAGYAAAIVYNNLSQANLIPMSGSHGSEVNIPAAFVSYHDGIFLSADFLYTAGYYIVLTPDYPAINLNAILLPFAIVVGICFFVLTMVLVAKYVRDRRRQRRHRLPRSQLSKITIRKYKKGEGNDVCAICLDEFEEGDKLRVLPCHHQYHCKCIDPWLLNNKRVCPVCKRKVIPGDSSDEEGTLVGRTVTTREPSESTPLLSPAHDATTNATGGPLENDLPTQQAPPLLINIEFVSDDEDYDGDTEEASTHASARMRVSGTGVSQPPPRLPFSVGEPVPSTPLLTTQDVPLIRLTDSQPDLGRPGAEQL